MKPDGMMGLALLLLLASVRVDVGAQEPGLDELFKNLPQSTRPTEETPKDSKTPETPPTPVRGGPQFGQISSWSLSGEQDSVYRLPIFRDPLSYSGIYLKPRVENTFRVEGKLGAAKFVSGWEVDLWPLGTPSTTGGTEVLSAGPADVTLAPGDNYVQVASRAFSLQVGYFVDAWGAADVLNPTNNINPVDYTKGLFPERIPSFLLRALYYPDRSLSIEAVFEPYKRDDLFPVSPLASIPTTLFPSSEITVSEPPVDLSSAVCGIKATLYTSLADLSLSYLYDVDPYYTPRVSYPSYQNRSLDLVRTRISRIGADAKSTLGAFGLWLETCLSITEDPKMTSYSTRNPFLSWTAGSDANWGPGGSFYLNVQYTGRYVFGYDASFYTDYPGGSPNPVLLATDPSYATEYYSRALSQSLGDENEGFLNGLIVETEFPFAGGRWTPALTAAYYLPLLYDTSQGTRYGSLVLEPSLRFKPADSVAVSLGGELMFAWKKNPGANQIVLDTADRIGRWNDQSNLYLGVDFTW